VFFSLFFPIFSKNVLQENEARKKLSASLKNKDSEINNLKEKVDSINNDIRDIKDLLGQLINKRES
jgi:peptidoglycan hydrolase CwlO-like protein